MRKLSIAVLSLAALAGPMAGAAGAAGPTDAARDAYCTALERAGVVFVQDCRSVGPLR